MADAEFRCPHCGGLIDAPADARPDHCPHCGGSLPPSAPDAVKKLDIETWFEAPAAAPPLPPSPLDIPPPDLGPLPVEPELEILEPPPPPPPAEELPAAALDPEDVPVVVPAARRVPPKPAAGLSELPEARPLSPTRPPAPSRVEPPRPVRPADEVAEPPRPRVGLAVVVLLVLFLAVVGGCSLITYALYAGFKAFSRPRKVEAPPVVAPAPAADPRAGPEAAPAPRPVPERVWAPPDRVFAVRPTAVKGSASVSLPARPPAAYPAGGGRYLVLPLPDVHLLAVLDTASGRVAKYLPAPERDPLIACGMTRVFVLDPAGMRCRWLDLESFTEGVSAPLPPTGRPVAAAVGDAAAGPLAVVVRSGGGVLRLVLLDPDWLTPRAVEYREPNLPPFAKVEVFERRDWKQAAVRASADGHVLVVSGWDDTAGEAAVIELTGSTGVITRVRRSPGLAAPTADGRTVLGHDWVFRDGLVRPTPRGYPTVDGSGWFRTPNRGGRRELQLHLPGAKEPVTVEVTLPGFPEPPPAADPLADRRAVLIPAAGLFAYLSQERAAVELRRIDIPAALAESGEPYLVVTSSPPRTAVRGSRFTYRPVVRTDAPAAVLVVAEGPPGMRVEDGQVVWDVPAHFADPGVRVRLTAGQVGRELTDGQSFWLRVLPPGARPPAVIDPPVGKAGGRKL